MLIRRFFIMRKVITGTCILVSLLLVFALSTISGADSNKLYGIHWWGWNGSTIDTTPATMLDSVSQSAWDLETIITDSDTWWRAPFFSGLYQELSTNQNVTIITRIDFNWGETVPHENVSA